MRHRVQLLAASLLTVLFPAGAWAADGVLLVQTVDTGAGTTLTSSQIRVEPTRIRTEIDDGSGRQQVVIFDGTKEVLYVVEPEGRSYMEMTKADAARMGGMVQGAMAMMQQQMANMSPAQRQMMEQKMAGMMGGGAAGAGMAGAMAMARPEYRQVGTDKVGDWACTRYDGYASGQKTSEICTVQPEALGFSMDDFAVLGQLSEFVRSIMPQMGDRIVSLGTDEMGFSGLPVSTATTDPTSGRTITMRLTEARRATFADSDFAVPAGFTKRAMPMMGQ